MYSAVICLNVHTVGLTPVVLTSLETRYDFSSIELGILSSTFDLTVLVTVSFISYFATNSHQPRWLGAGACFLGVGTLMFASPRLLTGDYNMGKNANLSFEACRDKNDFSPDCDEESDHIYFVFILAKIVIGIGGAPLFPIGTSFIDDIIHPKYVSICLGIFYTMAIIGPTFGFGIGGILLKVYVDPWKDTTLDESDPGWVGAWWIPYLLFGILALIISIPFFFFPKKFSNTDFIRQERLEQARREGLKIKDFTAEFNIWEFPRQVFTLLSSVTYSTTMMSHALMIFSAAGMLTFFPKYMEALFGLKASSGALVGGAVGITTATVGIMLGMVNCMY